MNNQIYILILCSFIGVALFWFLLLLIDSARIRYLRKRYNEYNDLSKQGELRRNKGASEFGRIEQATEREFIAEGFNKSQGRDLLQTTASLPTGQNSKSNGNFFGLFKRK